MKNMQLEITQPYPEVKLVKITGNLSGERCESFKNTVEMIIADRKTTKECIIDIRDVNFMDSRGIGALLFEYMHLKESGLSTAIITGTNQDSPINQLLHSTNLHKVLAFITSLGNRPSPSS